MRKNQQAAIMLGAFAVLLLAVYLLSNPSITDRVSQSSGAEVSLPSEPTDTQTVESWSADFPLGVKAVDPSLILIPTSGDAFVRLLDHEGRVVHKWQVDADRARLLSNGNLLVVHGSKWGAEVEPWRSLRTHVREYDWAGDLVWEYVANEKAHHDVFRLPDQRTLFLEQATVTEGVAERIRDPERARVPLISDRVVEVDLSGGITWSWNAHDHFDWNSCGRTKCMAYMRGGKSEAKVRDWTHLNAATVLPENRWFDAGDERFRPGNILVQPRNFWETYLIARENGAILWRYGEHEWGGVYRGHDPHMIPKGFPGEGNILLLDNGMRGERPYSLALEIDPITKEVVWSYQNKGFFAHAAGTLQRLRNGNTFISEDPSGRIFEVNASGEKVFEMKAPLRVNRPKKYPFTYSPQTRKIGKEYRIPGL